MKILHISLGNPKSHSGGLNRYCRDLMECQKARGDTVFILHPGSFVCSHRPYVIAAGDSRYILFNGLPTAITYGIDDPGRYMQKSDVKYFRKFLSSQKPDIIHVHSIQGIPLELFVAAKELQIPMVYTTHDYYLMCVRCTFMNHKNELCTKPSPEKCAKCCCGAGLSSFKQRLLQSELYSNLKKVDFIQRNAAKSVQPSEKTVESNWGERPDIEKGFYQLMQYHQKIIKCFSLIHCNSRLSEEQYLKFYPDSKTRVLPITHSGIVKHPHKTVKRDSFHIGYMGGPANNKGWRELIAAAQILSQSDGLPEWSIWMYGGVYPRLDDIPENVHFCGTFDAADGDVIWSDIDILTVPSTSLETFGFVVLEALSYGIPVITSDTVGANFLLPKQWIYPHEQVNILAEKLRILLTPDGYRAACEQLVKIHFDCDMSNHVQKLDGIYREAVGVKAERTGIQS